MIGAFCALIVIQALSLLALIFYLWDDILLIDVMTEQIIFLPTLVDQQLCHPCCSKPFQNHPIASKVPAVLI
jgi:hypothetical protein